MTRKLKLTAFLCSFALLSVYIILPCFEMTSGLAWAPNAVSARAHRHLKTLLLSTVDENRGRVEERGSGSVLTILSEKLSGILKNLRGLFDRLMMRISPERYLAGASNQEMAISRLFYRFGVDEVKDDLFKSVQYNRWVNLIDKVLQKNPLRGRVAMYSTLAAHFSDAQLVRFFQEAHSQRLHVSNEHLAHIFEFYQWYLRTKAVDGVDNLDVNLLENLFFRTWVLYTTWCQKGSSVDFMLRANLIKRFSDHDMAVMLLKAMEDDQAATIAATVSGMSHEKLSQFRKDVIKVFKYRIHAVYNHVAEKPVSSNLVSLNKADTNEVPTGE